MSKIKGLAGQTLIYGLGTVVPRLLNYALMTPFYTRVLLKGEYGSVTILYSYVAFLLAILTYGMETTFFRFSQTEKDSEKVFSTASLSLLFTTLPFTILILLFNQSIANVIDYQSNPQYIKWLGLVVSLDVISSIPFAKLRKENKAIQFTAIKLLNVAINIGLNFFFLKYLKDIYTETPNSFLGRLYNPEISVGYVLIANLTASTFTIIALSPQYFKQKMRFDWTLWKRMIRYALPLLIVGLAAMINEVGDKLLLKILLPNDSEAIVGVYAANYRLALLMTIFIQMFKYAAEPFFFNNAKEKDAKITYANVMKYFIIFGLLIFLFITLFIDQVILFIGKEYREGVNVVPIILIANLFLGVYYNLSIWYKLTNKTHYGAVVSIFGAIVTLSINFYFIPQYSYWASAWATFAAYGSMMLLSWFWGRKFYKVDYPITRILSYTALTLALYWGFGLFSFHSELLKFVIGSIFILFFLTIIYFCEKKDFSFNPKNR